MSTIELDVLDLVVAALLVVASGILSLSLHLGLEKRLLVATCRMIVQLSIVGFLLRALFAVASPWWTGLAVVVMILFAGREIMARQERRMVGAWSYLLGTGSMLLASTLVTIFALTTQVQPDPW